MRSSSPVDVGIPSTAPPRWSLKFYVDSSSARRALWPFREHPRTSILYTCLSISAKQSPRSETAGQELCFYILLFRNKLRTCAQSMPQMHRKISARLQLRKDFSYLEVSPNRSDHLGFSSNCPRVAWAVGMLLRALEHWL